ncbi:MAG: uracil-DNA glycosylase [Gemmatimonadaceae bacterium]|nr:uracil-DNA glycosylase [Gemmatimonadaceae bacterium]
MDARDKLRLYLEQRRDLGESELILDSMTVEEALRAIGALARGGSAPARSPQDEPVASGDWRTVLGQPSALPEPEPAAPPGPGLVAGAAPDELFNADVMGHTSLKTLASALESCTRCPLYKTANHAVPGEGNTNARLVCVGEAPGASEDETGRPFVGAAGQLLTKILAAVDLTREEVFIGNVIKHRPPGNRNPTPGEIEACSPWLVRQLELIKPKVILALGTFAAQTLLNTKTPLGKLRGEIHRYHGIPVVVTYHPAALLRNPSWKRPTWEDVKLARRILDSASGA